MSDWRQNKLFCKPSGRLWANKTLISKKTQPSIEGTFFQHFKVRWHLWCGIQCAFASNGIPIRKSSWGALTKPEWNGKNTEVVGVVCKDPARRKGIPHPKIINCPGIWRSLVGQASPISIFPSYPEGNHHMNMTSNQKKASKLVASLIVYKRYFSNSRWRISFKMIIACLQCIGWKLDRLDVLDYSTWALALNQKGQWFLTEKSFKLKDAFHAASEWKVHPCRVDSWNEVYLSS